LLQTPNLAVRALPTTPPLLSEVLIRSSGYARVRLFGFSESGALAYVTLAQGYDGRECNGSSCDWEAKVLAIQSVEQIALLRFGASGEGGGGESGKISGTVAAARKAHQCEAQWRTRTNTIARRKVARPRWQRSGS